MNDQVATRLEITEHEAHADYEKPDGMDSTYNQGFSAGYQIGWNAGASLVWWAGAFLVGALSGAAVMWVARCSTFFV